MSKTVHTKTNFLEKIKKIDGHVLYDCGCYLSSTNDGTVLILSLIWANIVKKYEFRVMVKSREMMGT